MDGLDRAALEAELASAVAREREYRAVDDMKKRAITSAGSYEEFKNLVACATLTPLSRDDTAKKTVVSTNRMLSASAAGAGSAVSGGGGGGGGGFGFGTVAGASGLMRGGADEERAAGVAAALAARRAAGGGGSGGAPATPAEFERAWRRLSGDAGARLAWLVAQGGGSWLAALYATSPLDADLLASLVAACVGGAAGDGDAVAAAIGVLDALTRCHGFARAVALLSSSERGAVASLVASLPATSTAAGAESAPSAERVAAAFRR